MQPREGVWENLTVYRRGFTQRLSSSPKLPQVFASGYVNTASVLYFLDSVCRDANIVGNQSERALYNFYFIKTSIIYIFEYIVRN